MTDEELAEDVRAKTRELNIALESAADAGLEVTFETYETKGIRPGRYRKELHPKIMKSV